MKRYPDPHIYFTPDFVPTCDHSLIYAGLFVVVFALSDVRIRMLMVTCEIIYFYQTALLCATC